ncbi:MAG: peptidyl-prolyl cis-trans isomerase [Phycisphaerae bacterium]|nr:peptidyl-prolyl cis-trans isomerase [Phycisphaerae bacterium]
MRKAGLILLIVIGMLFVCEYVYAEQAAEPNLPQDTNQAVMIFDGKELTLKQIEYLAPSLNYAVVEDIANFWLDTQLLYEEAVKRNIDKDEKVKFISDIGHKKTVSSELLAKVRNDARVTDEDVRKYYEQNKETDPALREPTFLSFSHITVSSLPEAEAVLKKINEGNDINQLARELSTASDAQKGGKANKFQENTVKSRFGDEFLAALLNATEGQLIGPIKDKDGNYEIARHEGKRASKVKDFEKVQQVIKTNLENQAKEKAVKDLINSLKEKAKQKYKKTGILSEKNSKQESNTKSQQKDN